MCRIISEGKAFFSWRDEIWIKAFELIDEIKNGTKTPGDFVYNLPKLEIA